MSIELRVNGATHRVETDPQCSLLAVLRDDLGLTAAKYGCGEGACGACTVLLDGKPIRSCSTRVSVAAGHAITTLEGLESAGKLHPVQQAFIDAGAMQCGYCISGMIMSSVALLKTNPHPSDAEIIRAMDGNVCRCGTHPKILAAIRAAGGAR